MKNRASLPAVALALFVVLAFVLVVTRWVIVIDLAADVDTHRLTDEEERALLVERTAATKNMNPAEEVHGQ